MRGDRMANKNPTENHTGDADYSTALAIRFIGRDAEVAAIDRVARMDTTQLVQIIGEGGAGKTRLLKRDSGTVPQRRRSVRCGERDH